MKSTLILFVTAVLPMCFGSAYASSITLQSKNIEDNELTHNLPKAYYINRTAATSIYSEDNPTVLRFNASPSIGTLMAIRTTENLTFTNDSNIEVLAPSINKVFGLSAESASISAKNLALKVQGQASTALFLYESSLTNLDSLELHALGNTSAIALNLADSNVNINGRVHLTAQKTDDRDLAISMDGGNLNLTSQGHTQINGNIDIQSGSAKITLQNPTDRWQGWTLGCLDLTLRNEAQWVSQKHSHLRSWTWGQGGILDVRGLNQDIIIEADNLHIENGAILKVDMADATAGQQIDLHLKGLSNTQAAEIKVDADNSTHTNNDFVVFLNGNGANYVSLSGASTQKQTALHTVSSTPVIEALGNGLWAITGIREKTLGASTLMDQQLDFYASSTIASEQMTDRSVSRAIDRAIHQPKTNGHWIDVHYSETKLNLDHAQRQQTLKTSGIEMGFDRYLNLPFLSNGLFSVSAAYSQNDVTMTQGQGDIDQWSINVYATGVTEDQYRLLLGGHYQRGNANLTSNAYLGNQKAEFAIDREVLGVSAYLGFVPTSLEKSSWHFEPFVMGSLYRIKSDDTHFNELKVTTETLQQSTVRAGITVSYQSDAYPFRLITKTALAHRLGDSVSMSGWTDSSRGSFVTEDLKETWGELSLEGRWCNDRGLSVSTRIQAAKSHDVKPQFDLGVHLKLHF